MSHLDTDYIMFELIVDQLTITFTPPEKDIRVTVCIGDMSKITCAGELSEDGLTVTWNHPFIFTTPPSATVGIAVCNLPELAPGWDKQPLGDQILTNVANLLATSDGWHCNVPGLSDGLATLIMTCKPTTVPIVSNGHDCHIALAEYDTRLYEFARQFQSMPCLSTEIEVGLARLDLCPPGHKGYLMTLDHLACTFQYYYDQGGNVSDLKKAIEIYETVLGLEPLGHPMHTWTLRELALCLWKLFEVQNNKSDLDRALEMQERRLELCPSGHSEHERALGNLAMSLLSQYRIQGDLPDLHRCIEMGEKRLDLCPPGHPCHNEALGNLSISLMARYYRHGNLNDLDKAIDLDEKTLQLCPSGYSAHGSALQNLAMSLLSCFHALKAHSDLVRVIELLKETLVIFPVQHHNFAFNASELAAANLLLFKSQHQQPSPDAAFNAYRELKRCSPAVSFNLLEATWAWIKDAEEYNHPSALEAYETSLSALDHFTSFDSSLDSRHESMQTKVSDLANDAFSWAIRHGNFHMAVELLEQGRGILWSQLARFDISIATLESEGGERRALGEKFMRLSADLRKYAQGSGGEEPYWRVHEEWQSTVDKIRNLDGFSRFLLPPVFDDLQQAADYGPVIIVNASKYDCDALIVVHTGPPVHVSLPCSLTDVVQLRSQLSELTQDIHAYGDNRESWVKQVLRDLWSSVVEPIVDVLRNDIQLPSGSRIWWCPTSEFTNLPLHAAGPYRNPQKNLMDIYVSSYAPSLSALIRARDCIRSRKAARDASGTANPISFAVVGQGQPSADAKLGSLPEVDHEIQRIRDETGIPSEVLFDTVTGDAATIEGAVQAFRDHRWVHIACHGAQHAQKPFESWFAMGDGKLTLMRIIQERYTNSEFAFLSACHTAVGDESTPDEVLHLAAGMQFAGFNGVIGTLWRVDDAVAHQVVTRFYKEMFRHPVVDFEHAASALNTAAVETADQVSLEKRIVFVHIRI